VKAKNNDSGCEKNNLRFSETEVENYFEGNSHKDESIFVVKKTICDFRNFVKSGKGFVRFEKRKPTFYVFIQTLLIHSKKRRTRRRN
jgi:hypothetical protein